jgi:hypothetical protein
VGYCVVCYLVTALLFSLLILDLAALVVTTCPAKAIFKYTDLVYVSEWRGSPGTGGGGGMGFFFFFEVYPGRRPRPIDGSAQVEKGM